MSESRTQSEILLGVGSLPDTRLFRNSTGFGFVTRTHVAGSRPITFGLHPGSGDLIGWKTVVITPEMVGRRLARFLSVEVKGDKTRVQGNQIVWRDAVNAAGGIAVIGRSDAEVKLAIERCV